MGIVRQIKSLQDGRRGRALILVTTSLALLLLGVLAGSGQWFAAAGMAIVLATWIFLVVRATADQLRSTLNGAPRSSDSWRNGMNALLIVLVLGLAASVSTSRWWSALVTFSGLLMFVALKVQYQMDKRKPDQAR